MTKKTAELFDNTQSFFTQAIEKGLEESNGGIYDAEKTTWTKNI